MAEKDLYLKMLTQSLSQGAMRAIGIEDIELAELLPTVLPAADGKPYDPTRDPEFHLEPGRQARGS